MEEQNKSKIVKIVVDRNLCIGCGSCAALASKTFEIDEENKSVVKNGNPERDDDETILMTAKSCPVEAIILYDENGKQIYPVKSEDSKGI